MKEIQNDRELDSAANAGSIPFTLTRRFDVPRDLVFRAFSEAKHLAHWWGPKGMKKKTLVPAVPHGVQQTYRL